MLHTPWKKRLLQFTQPGGGRGLPVQTRLEFPQTVLGRRIILRKTMPHSFHWLNKIKGPVKYDEFLSDHTSIRIGGPADIFIIPDGIEDVKTILKNLGSTPLFVLGEGTNLLVRDKGIRGIVLSLGEQFRFVRPPSKVQGLGPGETAVLRAGAGVKLSYLAKYAARYALTGLEHLVGIPGSLGGALIMNAGAEGTEIGQVVRSVTRVTKEGEVQVLKKEDLHFEYRKTIFPPGEGIIVEAELELTRGDLGHIHETMDRHLSRRNLKQPLTIPNSGSVFKNPPGDTAGRLIESAGLKGYTIGDAGVSLKHANFIVNKGEATASDVLSLIDHVRKVVREKTGRNLETEIVVAGE